MASIIDFFVRSLALGTALSAFIGLFMMFSVVGPLAGAASGLVVGWVFDDSMRAFISWTGLHVEPWQIGLVLGFVGGFFRAQISTTEKKDENEKASG